MSSPLLKTFGCATEGTEPTRDSYPCLWADGGWTTDGVNEAANYRLEAEPRKLAALTPQEFISCLDNNQPIRVETSNHVVAVVGYDKTAQTFKYVNNYGDLWGQNGFGTFTFQQLTAGQPTVISDQARPIIAAYVLEKWKTVPPPRPVPVARIALQHSKRGNVQLWLSAENSPHPPRQIWPLGKDDSCRNLTFTVRLPNEFIWPPSPNNRLILDLYDSAEYSNTGGELKEFSAVFGGHIIPCSEVSKASVKFKAREHRRFLIPSQ